MEERIRDFITYLPMCICPGNIMAEQLKPANMIYILTSLVYTIYIDIKRA